MVARGVAGAAAQTYRVGGSVVKVSEARGEGGKRDEGKIFLPPPPPFVSCSSSAVAVTHVLRQPEPKHRRRKK